MGIFSRLFGKKEKPQKPAGAVTPNYSRPAPPPPPVQPAQPEPQGKTYKITGTSHYWENILSLGSKNDDYTLGKRALIEEGLTETRIWEYDFFPSKAELVPEPENPHDPKAIMVLVDGLQVGYIKAGSCSHLLRVIAEERIQKIDVKVGGGKYKCLEVIDYKENGDEVYNLDRGELPLYVHLNITEKPEA